MRTHKAYEASCFAITLSIGLAAALTAGAADFSAWPNKMKLTFQGYDKSETLSNFPALVVLGTSISNFSYSQFASTNGYDLRFSASDGTIELNYEIEKWNTGGSSYVWVQVPSLAGSSDYIWAYWGNAGQTAQQAYTTNGATWASACKGVWHLGEQVTDESTSTGAHRDSTANANNGNQNRNSFTNGVVGGGQYLDGSSDYDYIEVPNSGSLDMGRDFTFSGWVRWQDNGTLNYNRFVSRAEWSPGWEIRAHYETDMQPRLNGGDQATFNLPSSDKWTSNNWHHIAVVYSNDYVYSYHNGHLKNSSSPYSGNPDNDNPLMLGRISPNGGNYWKGSLDELRIEDATRSSNWIWACWLNMASNGTFNAYGAAEEVVGTDGPVVELK